MYRYQPLVKLDTNWLGENIEETKVISQGPNFPLPCFHISGSKTIPMDFCLEKTRFKIKCSSNLMCPIESWDLKIGGEIPEACCYTDIRLNGLHYHIYDMYQTWTLPQNLNEAIFWFKKASPQKISPKYYPLNICYPNIITVCGRISF